MKKIITKFIWFWAGVLVLYLGDKYITVTNSQKNIYYYIVVFPFVSFVMYRFFKK